MSLLFIVRAGFWLVTTSLAIAAMTTKKSLYTASNSYGNLASVELDVGMFTTKGSSSVAGYDSSASTDTPKFFDDIGLESAYAKTIQGGAISGLLLSTLSFAVCVLAYAFATGCSGTCLKTISLLLDLVAAAFFLISWAVIVAVYNMNVVIDQYEVNGSLSSFADLGPGVGLLATCMVLTIVSACMACCIAPRHTEERVPLNSAANTTQQDYTSAH